MMRLGKNYLLTLRQTQCDASCSTVGTPEAIQLSRCCSHIVRVAAAIEFVLIRAPERLCSEYKRECLRIDESRRVDTRWLDDVAGM